MPRRSSAIAWGLALLLSSLAWLYAPGDATAHGITVTGGQMRQAAGEWTALDGAVLATWPGPYELRWQLNLAQGEQALGLRLALRGAADLFCDGALVLRSGRPGRSAEEEVPGPIDRWLALPPLAAGTHELRVVGSSQHLRAGQIAQSHAGLQPMRLEAMPRQRFARWLVVGLACGGLALAWFYFLHLGQASTGSRPGRQRLMRLCREIVGPAFVATAVGSLDEARDQLRDRSFDGLLLDLNVAGHDGFGLLREAAAAAMHVVVVSGHGERALEAFELGVLDFVPKPFGRERLELALQRLQGAPVPGARALRRVAVWRARGVALVDIDQVTCIAAVPEGSELHLEGGRTELHDKPLERLLPLLPPNFLRCHRTWIVNLAVVKALHSARGSRSWIELADGRELPVGRSRLQALREQLAQA